MDVIITIFKQQLEDTPQVKVQLTRLSQQVTEISTAILFIPKEDDLITFIDLLNTNRISFGVHASGEEIPDIIRGSGQSNAG